MTASIAIMYAVSALFTAIGLALLLALLRPRSEGRVYAFRMIGTMGLALGAALVALVSTSGGSIAGGRTVRPEEEAPIPLRTSIQSTENSREAAAASISFL
ncbi:MAG: hypothetical protein ABGZ17_05425, partial [Planctomycetaceae bacterium]